MGREGNMVIIMRNVPLSLEDSNGQCLIGGAAWRGTLLKEVCDWM